MKKLLFALAIIFTLIACDTIVTTKTLKSETWTFVHAGKEMKLLLELKQIRTSRRSNEWFNRNVSYSHEAVISASQGKKLQELYSLPFDKNGDLNEIIRDLKIKRSKDRSRFAIGHQNSLVAIFYVFKDIRFVGYAPNLNSNLIKDDFSSLDLEKEPKAREIILEQLGGNTNYRIEENLLAAILKSLPANDELNEEFLVSFARNIPNQMSISTKKEVIAKNVKSNDWRKKASRELSNFRNKHSDEELINLIFLIDGKEALKKEDKTRLDLYRKNGEYNYFEERQKHKEIPLDKEVKNELKSIIRSKVMNVCSLSAGEYNRILNYIRTLEDLGESNVFDSFLASYGKSSCRKSTLGEFNNDFMFGTSELRVAERRVWVEFVYTHFGEIESGLSRSFAYDRIKDYLSCEQNRALLTKYKTDIDTFNKMEIPTCK
jgi:hypothetical protein